MIISLFVLVLLTATNAQQCTTLTYQRCLCTTSTPYCPCSALTSTNALNFNSNYNSHLIAQAGQGCRPCPSSCLKCSSPTLCSQCFSSYQLSLGQCIPCPVNCQSCLNSICQICMGGYFLDYQTHCQNCPIKGSSVCTISSLIGCLPNYWLDNNAANCINCDINCQQCSSTTKCSLCSVGYYLANNYTCLSCLSYCLSCSDGVSCLQCANLTLYFNQSQAACVQSTISYCLQALNSTRCQLCMPGYYLNTSYGCSETSIISNCQSYQNINGIASCKNCTVGYYNTSTGCNYGCSIMCSSCYGPHFGLCFACSANAYLFNLQCLPNFNINGGAAYQLYYTAFNNPSFFSTQNGIASPTLPYGCLPQTIIYGTSISFALLGLQSYQVTLKWKIYLFNLDSTNSTTYSLSLNNLITNISLPFSSSPNCLSNCSTITCLHLGAINITGILLNNNNFVFSAGSQIGISQLLVVAYRCGGVQGSACQQCSSNSQCTKCVNSNFYISGYTCVISCHSSEYVRVSSRTCVVLCPQGTYTVDADQQCLECLAPCLTCTSSSICSSCQVNWFWLNNKCLSQCPSGYYANSLRRTCQKCLRPCLTCLSNILCLSCIYGFYQNTTNSCVLNCGKGYYGSIDTLTCQVCIDPCLLCSSTAGNQCSSCKPGYYYYNQHCLLICPAGFYSSIVDGNCIQCDIRCLTCDQFPTNCTSCPLGTYLYNHSCLTVCPVLYFSNFISNQCQNCPVNCMTCLNNLYCKSCVSGYFYYSFNYSCLDVCPPFYFGQASKCISCQLPCRTCLTAQKCLSCQGLFIFNFSCVSTCPSGTYRNSLLMTCLDCNLTACKQCSTSPTTCTQCSLHLILFQNQCYLQCPEGYYKPVSDFSCLPCSQKCQNCLNFTYCLKCNANYIVQNGYCIKQCDTGYYPSTINVSTSCLPCPISCSSCFSANITTIICTQCISSYLLFKGSCILICPITYYGLNGKCFVCAPPCLTCSSQGVCGSCLVQYGMLFNSSCLSICPLGYFENTTANTCDRCSSACLKCKFSPDRCESCASKFFLSGTSCYSQCPASFYSFSSASVCKNCNYPCLTCYSSPTNCTSCYGELTLFNGECLSSCSQGYYYSNNQCISCPSSCSKCINSTYCLSCSNSYSLTHSFLCQSSCPSSYFSFNNYCKMCIYPCKTCTTYSNCSSCLSGYFYSGSCLSTCPTSTYLNKISQQCLSCPSNCSSCLQPLICSECLVGVLVNGSCQQNCAVGYYEYYGICAPCMYGCLNCVDSSVCKFCYIGYLYKGLCLQFCPQGWVSNLDSSLPICLKCVDGCLKCIIQPNECTLCASGLYLFIFSCVQSCPLGTYHSLQSSSCVTCKTPCQTCDNRYSCNSCIYGYLLYAEQSGNQCIKGPNCPNSYYLNLQTNICVFQCPTHLYIEPIQSTCSKPCPTGFLLYKQNATCLGACPNGMWINSEFVCQAGVAPIQLPVMVCRSLFMRNLMMVGCEFNLPIQNIGSLKTSNFSILGMIIESFFMVNQTQFILVTTQQPMVILSTYLTLKLTSRYQLYSSVISNDQSVYESQRRLTVGSYRIPVQNINSTFLIPQFYSYSLEQRQTGLQLMQISQSICIGAFIFWFLALIKNMKSTSLTFIATLQWIYSMSLLDTALAPNIAHFMQGFKTASLLLQVNPPQQHPLWLVVSQYRQSLWGVVNLFDFRTTLLPSLCIVVLFTLIWGMSHFLYWKYSPKQTEQSQQNQINVHQGSRKSYKLQQDEINIKAGKLQNSKVDKLQVDVGKCNKSQKESKTNKSVDFKSQKKSQIQWFEDQNKNVNKSKSKLDSQHVSQNSVKRTNSLSHKSQNNQSKKNNQSKILSTKVIQKLEQLSKQTEKSSNLNDNLSQPEQNQSKQRSQSDAGVKFSQKCKLIRDRFYFNYWLHCILFTASPFSITICCQIIAANSLSLTIALLLFLSYIAMVVVFIRKSCGQEKILITTKYWFILVCQTHLQTSLAILGTTQVYLGILILTFLVNIYVWNRIFSSHRSNQLKHFFQINDLLKLVILLQALVGYTNRKHWDSNTYYNYSWIFIVTLFALIILVTVHSTKQFFDMEQGRVKEDKSEAHSQLSDMEHKENTNVFERASSELSSVKLERGQSSGKQEQQSLKLDFFSHHQPVGDSDSDDDIIDFDEVGEVVEQQKAANNLIKYQKES